MPYRTSAARAVREYLAPFLASLALALGAVGALGLETGFGDGDGYLAAAFGALLLAATGWTVASAGDSRALMVRRIASFAVPVALALLLLDAVLDVDALDGVAGYLAMLLIAASAVRFWPGLPDARPPEASSDAGARALRIPSIGRRAFAGLAAGTILLGTGLCAHEAFTTPTISVDESHSANAAYGILSRGLPYFPNTEVVYSRSWANLFPMAASFAAFGFSEESARLPSVLAFAGGLAFLFLALREVAGRRTALAALLLAAVNPWILHYGAYARMYIFLFLWSSAFSYLVLRYLRTRSARILYLWLPLVLVLGLLSERTFLLFTVPYGLLVLWSLPRTRAFYLRSLLALAVPAIALLAAVAAYWEQVAAFVSRYVIGFNNGANPLANATLQGVPVEWLSYFGLPAVLLAFATTLIVVRGSWRLRTLLAVFWFGVLLVDLLIYSNFPARRFNYAFILVSLYVLVLAGGLSVFWKLARPVERLALGGFVLAFGLYASLASFEFPAYADFSALRAVPPGSVVVGYPTSPIAFYDIKYGLGMDIRPFITDTVEMEKYVENGRDIYAGGAYVTGVSELNDLRAGQDVYVLFEKTRMDFLNFRTNDYVYTQCEPLTEADALEIADAVADGYEPDDEDYDRRDILLALRCPQLPGEPAVLP